MCQECSADRQSRFGCRPGTVSEVPFQAGRFKLDRCPHALQRETPPADAAWIEYSLRWAHAKADGSLPYLLPHPSAFALDVINAIEEEWAGQRREHEKEQTARMEADRAALTRGR